MGNGYNDRTRERAIDWFYESDAIHPQKPLCEFASISSAQNFVKLSFS